MTLRMHHLLQNKAELFPPLDQTRRRRKTGETKSTKEVVVMRPMDKTSLSLRGGLKWRQAAKTRRKRRRSLPPRRRKARTSMRMKL